MARSALDEAQAFVERAKHAGEVMTALEDQPVAAITL